MVLHYTVHKMRIVHTRNTCRSMQCAWIGLFQNACRDWRPSHRLLRLYTFATIVLVGLWATLMGGGVFIMRQNPFMKPSTVVVQSRKCACIHPTLQLWHPSMVKQKGEVAPLKCSSLDENWVTVENGTFRISEQAILKYGQIYCTYTPLFRGETDFEINEGVTVRNVVSGFRITSDFFETRCVSEGGIKYRNIHSGIYRRKEGQSPVSNQTHIKTHLNILMFGFDSTSRMAWLRYLPKTHAYFVNILGGTVMEGYNIVGDGTPAALLPLLTGKNETELPEARRGHHGAKPVDGHPWIWKRLKREGYVTQYGEDLWKIGTFHYRMLGFKKQPVDHYMRPFYMHAERILHQHRPFCLGSIPRHVNMMNWVKELFAAYPDRAKFSFLFHSEFSHGDHVRLSLVDDDMVRFLRILHESGYLDRTLLVLMSDHGARFHAVRKSVQGKQEERMPYMTLRLPPSFVKQHPIALRNLQANSMRLTTPYDVHETFLDVIRYDSVHTEGDLTHRGISLLKAIPPERSCKHAGIAMHWCACLQWKVVSTESKNVIAAAEALVEYINEMTNNKRTLCDELSLSTISQAQQYTANEHLLRFKESSDDVGLNADFSDNMKALDVHYQITVITAPGQATYEATVTLNTKTGKFSLSSQRISRTNRYGDQPHCIAAHFPHLRQYCYCKN